MCGILVSFGDRDNSILLLQMFRIKIHDLFSVILNFNKFTFTKTNVIGWMDKQLVKKELSI